MKMKLFKHGYLIRHAFDLGRIFPIIIKHRGVSKIIVGIGSQIIDAPTNIWLFLSNLDLQIRSGFLIIFPGWISEMWLYVMSTLRLDMAIPFLVGQ